jgi:hypothetical protein
LKEALEACKSLKQKHISRRVTLRHPKVIDKHPMARDDLERDFTSANGTPSNLECPFAKLTNGDPPGNPGADPIAAEFHGDGSVGSGTAYAQQNPNKCPIRYLDQHSPEELAKYFENHKHEIPRSHAVCISSYQQNDAKIRQLDTKYGNLQNMIQSLGVKHQQYLPAKDDEQDVQRGSSQAAAVSVEKWAENVSQKSQQAAPPLRQPGVNGIGHAEQDERTQHFEKPLREIRLGESPSRPWGISVPVAQERAESAIASDKGIEPLSLDRSEGESIGAAEAQRKGEEAGQCPFGHGEQAKDLPNGVSHSRNALSEGIHAKGTSPAPQMVFNGPVFFGYSPEQVTAMMHSGLFDSSKR